MKARGSVLIVVLGLLAILAVIGAAFATMSAIDRFTAVNFAANTQMMMAADSGVEYASHYLVSDLWVRSTSGAYSGLLLPNTTACEYYDCPGTNDPWLSDPITAAGSTPATISFADTAVSRYGLTFNSSSSSSSCDNLGIGGINGVFLSDLAMPFERHVVRVSITILDHNGLVNLNAHGNQPWSGAVRGRGYYVSDVTPGAFDTSRLLFSSGDTLGRWGATGNGPNIPEIGETCIENPTVVGENYPFTLDEEFELRRVQANALNNNQPGTIGHSRLEAMASGSSLSVSSRLAYTTVGWTAEVRGDGNAASHRNAILGTSSCNWSRPKAALNRDKAQLIYEALNDCRVSSQLDQLGQLAANIVGFRSSQNRFVPMTINSKSFVGATRQPILTEVLIQATFIPAHTDAAGVSVPDKNQYKVRVEVHNPWPELDVSKMKLECDFSGADANTSALTSTSTMADGDTVEPLKQADGTTEKVFEFNTPTTLTAVRLTVDNGKLITLDELPTEYIPAPATLTAEVHKHRRIYTCNEERGPGCNIRILYLGTWEDATDSWGHVVENSALENNAVPIRFPNSVASSSDGTVSTLDILAPYGSAPSFKAFARLGDLDQVLCPDSNSTAGDAFWPWTNRVAKCTGLAEEMRVKFNWWDSSAQPGLGATSPANAANALCVGGPWNDKLDNDGDGSSYKDNLDTGALRYNCGAFGGPEFRVAGRVNLNTMTTSTQACLNDGLTLNGRLTGLSRPIYSPAQIIANSASGNDPDGLARGFLEKRDWVFNRISNIATVRSDTFSVYGTVQLVDVGSGGSVTILRSRRFWALLDRSPSLAFVPTNSDFHPPRLMNFQWLD